eukprot:1188030-Prorocentrum_minimum.AAC.1
MLQGLWQVKAVQARVGISPRVVKVSREHHSFSYQQTFEHGGTLQRPAAEAFHTEEFLYIGRVVANVQADPKFGDSPNTLL